MTSQRPASCPGRILTATAVLCTILISIAPGGVIGVTRDITHGNTTISMAFVTVGDRDNEAHSSGYGAVDYVYQIGKHAVSAAQWQAVSDAVGGNFSGSPSPTTTGNQPVNRVNWYAAAEFCNWLTTGDKDQGVYNTGHDDWGQNNIPHSDFIDRSYRNEEGIAYLLPNEDEWYKAAFYDPEKGESGGYWLYATREDDPPAAIYPEGYRDVPGYTGGTDHPEPGDGVGAVYLRHSGRWPGGSDEYALLFPGGAYPEDVDRAGGLSFYGTMGQGGNVWEWNETLLGADNDVRLRRGGADNSPLSYMPAGMRANLAPAGTRNDLGFRVMMIPEPGTAAMLLAGAMGLLLWRRRRDGNASSQAW